MGILKICFSWPVQTFLVQKEVSWLSIYAYLSEVELHRLNIYLSIHIPSMNLYVEKSSIVDEEPAGFAPSMLPQQWCDHHGHAAAESFRIRMQTCRGQGDAKQMYGGD